MPAPVIAWFRQDLRLADNPALRHAARGGRPVIPVYIWAPEEEGDWPPGAASRWWLHHSLAALGSDLEKKGSRLIIRRGPTRETLAALLAETGASGIAWNRRYEPAAIARDTELKRSFPAESFNAALLHEPGSVLTKTGAPYQVFTPFYRSCLAQDPPPEPLPTPRRLAAPERWPDSLPLADLDLLPRRPWAAAFPEHWQPGERGARARLDAFLGPAVVDYPEARDHPARPGTSRLSPHLHFGEISPRTIWYRALEQAELQGGPGAVHGAEQYLREVIWREFAHQLLFHFPHTPTRPLREDFARFPWAESPDRLHAWQRGCTGYPLVDAGLRQLWTTGWMHNRVRMIVGSFLVKHLRISWREGAAWFWDTLVDADLANNTLGWQWIGGCGADAAPYFRIFNPMTQGEKFDREGAYTKRWCPELAGLSGKTLFAPWTAPEPPPGYPPPLVDHREAREAALAAFGSLK